MTGVILTASTLKNVTVEECKLDQANLRSANAVSLTASESDLRGADFGRAGLKDCALRQCRLDGADFSAASVSSVRLHGSTLDGIQGVRGGFVIASDQLVPLAYAVFAALGVVVDDELDDD